MSAKAPADARPLRRSDLWLRQTGPENAVYDPASGSVHLLNETAFAIWGLCDGGTNPDEMIDAICELSRMPREVVSEDVRTTLARFGDAGLITWISD